MSSSFSLPSLFRVSAACALAAACTLAWAGGGTAEGAPAGAKKPAASSDDPMDLLRQRLAERLGAQPPADSRSSNSSVMRVDNRHTPASGAAPAAAAGTVATATGAGKTAATTARSLTVRPPAAPAADAHIAATGPAAHEGHWDYAGDNGPDAWGRMKPEFNKCSTGQRQSPIDIRGGIAVQLEPIQFDYRVSPFKVIDNGHTVQVNLPAGNSITVLGRRYELLQFHFHRPSEERINGKQYDMVAHLVHKDSEGRLAVVAVLLERGGAGQPLVQAVWNALPLEKGEEQAAPAPMDLNKLLPEDRRYYTYMGSLTTPPCSEGVLWMVMKTPLPVTPEQVDIFARLYPMNARPVQQVAGRLIKESQ